MTNSPPSRPDGHTTSLGQIIVDVLNNSEYWDTLLTAVIFREWPLFLAVKGFLLEKSEHPLLSQLISTTAQDIQQAWTFVHPDRKAWYETFLSHLKGDGQALIRFYELNIIPNMDGDSPFLHLRESQQVLAIDPQLLNIFNIELDTDAISYIKSLPVYEPTGTITINVDN